MRDFDINIYENNKVVVKFKNGFFFRPAEWNDAEIAIKETELNLKEQLGVIVYGSH